MNTRYLLLAASALIMPGSAAIAQGSNADDGSLLSAIVVTAQKKSAGEKAQDVPIAITALGGAQLQALNVRSLDDLNSFAPNAQFDTNSSFRGYANFSFRGVGVSGSVPSVEPAVGLFVDGIYQGINAGAVSDSFDIGSIQILRGPQGTLFGRNVTGGAVLVENARPTDEFGGYLQGSYETGPEYSVSGAVNVPIVPGMLNARFAGYYRNDEGWFTNDFNGTPNGKLRTIIARPTFVLESGALKQTLIFEYGDVEGDGANAQGLNLRKGSFDIVLDEEGFTNRRWYSVTSETVIDVGFGDGTITNVLGYRDFREHDYADLDGGPTPFFHLATLTDQHQISDELRYAGTFGSIQLTTGLYYLHQKLDYHEARVPLVFGTRNIGGGGVQKHNSYGAFAQTDIAISDRLSAIAGIRYSYEKKTAQVVRLLPNQCLDVLGPCNFGNNPIVNRTRNWDSFNPKLGLNYKFNPDVLFYASFGKSTRSGGFNVRIASPLDPGTFDQESTSAYELGMKADFLDRRLRLNVALFRNDYSDLQRIVSQPGIASVQFIDNSADARMQGVEIDVTASPTRGLEFTGSVGYLDAHYTKVRGDLNGDLVVDARDLNLKLARAANWTFSVGGIYTLEFGSGASIKTQMFFIHRARSAALDDNSVFYPDYNDLRGDITFTLPNRTTSVSAYVRNLTNKPHNTAGLIRTAQFASGGYRSISEGRSWGIEVRHEF